MPNPFLEEDDENAGLPGLSEAELDVVGGGINPQPLPPRVEE